MNTKRLTVRKPNSNIAQIAKTLDIPEVVVIGLIHSGLLGAGDHKGNPTKDAIDQYKKYGTQWSPRQQSRFDPYDGIPDPEGWENPPIYSVRRMQIRSEISPQPSDDVAWIAQFYFRPNRYYFPDIQITAPIGGNPVKLAKAVHIGDGTATVSIYPDPENRLAMMCVVGNLSPTSDPSSEGLNIITPLLNHMAAVTDQPLKIVQSHWIGIPSGTINSTRTIRPAERELQLSDFTVHHPLIDAESLYRLGLNNSEPMYKFLSFYRVIEAVDKAQGEWCRKYNVPFFERTVSIVPAHPVYGKWAGAKFGRLNVELIKAHRTAIAHGGLSGKPVNSGSSAEALAEIEELLPIIRYVAKVRIENLRHYFDCAQTSQPNTLE